MEGGAFLRSAPYLRPRLSPWHPEETRFYDSALKVHARADTLVLYFDAAGTVMALRSEEVPDKLYEDPRQCGRSFP